VRRLASAVLFTLASTNALAASLNWNGSVSNLWSAAANWTPNAVPQSGDTLTFGLFANTTNDLPAANVYSAVRVGRGSRVSGNLVRVTDEIYGTFSAPVQTMGNVVGAYGLVSTYDSTFDVNGYDVFIGGATFNGAVIGTGSIHAGVPDVPDGRLFFNADSTFSGTVLNGRGGVTVVNADIRSASFQNGGDLSGTGRIGPLSSFGSLNPGGSFGNGVGILTTGSLTFVPSDVTYSVDIAGTAPGSGYDQLKVIGSVDTQLGNLQIRVTGVTPTPEQTFVILDNDGTDPIGGTFNGLPEGEIVLSSTGTTSFRISYHGGDGNDVVLTALAPAAAVGLTNSPSSSVTGQPVTLTATVASTSPAMPSGTVSFLDDHGTVLATATLNGFGHATTTFPFVQTTHVYARYEGDSNYGSRTSDPVYQQVNKAATSLSLSLSPNPAVVTEQVVATLQLSITPPGSAPQQATPFGTYTLLVDNVPAASANASGTSPVTINVPNQSLGDHTVTATYTDQTAGSQNLGYQNSSAGPLTLHVTAATMIVAFNVSPSEGNSSATILVPVILSGPMSQNVSVDYATADGTAKAGSDYQATTGTITFAPGETSKSIPITILGDTEAEQDEQFTIIFSNASGATLSTPQVTVTLTNDDPSSSVPPKRRAVRH